ncbi:MAG TPA: hypothetical protein VKB93_18495 [Thermoanaerobaculia bacterium]|nr:hypothetical protein [Thermoanaerobaculia bacterium]
MFDLEEELRALRDAFTGNEVPYALCGGLAVGVHGFPRATVDIDVLIPKESEPRARDLARTRGFMIEARPMSFSRGATEIRRISKIDPNDGEVLMLDLLLVTPAVEDVWQTRERMIWQGADLWVVSREGLIKLKLLRSSDQDLVDIRRLRGEE